MRYIPKEKFLQDSRKKITSSIHFRENLLKTQWLMNVLNEYHRIDNKIKSIPGLSPKHVFEKRRAELEELSIAMRAPNLFNKYIVKEYDPENN
jgi:hypothetical protein